MENQMEDRISGLPQPILHKILSLLSQKEAVRTCALSKSWLHVVSTRPNVEFRDSFFKGNKKTFMSFLDNTLQRYHDQKLNIQNFVLDMSYGDTESVSLLEKWIPIVMLNMGVKTFNLHLFRTPFELPWSVVLKAESLEKLVLHGCKLTQISPLDENTLLKHLQTLFLTHVRIADETFHNIMSTCPSIENVTIRECDGLRTVKVNEAYNLKHLDFRVFEWKNRDHSIEIGVPSIETIRIVGCMNWYHHHSYFPHLKSLCLSEVRMSTESLDGFSCTFPCLEVMRVYYCYGFEEFRLVSHSIKHLSVGGMDDESIKVSIDVPNILKFDYTGVAPRPISFTTTSSDWKSSITLQPSESLRQHASSWFHKLHEMLGALSQSEISLNQSIGVNLTTGGNQFDRDTHGEFYEPLYVGLLRLQINGNFLQAFSYFINDLLRICRPRNISQYWYVDPNSESTKLTEYVWKILITERDNRHLVWQQDLEEVNVEAFDENGQKWHPVVGTSLNDCATLLAKYQRRLQVCFRLKWKILN